MESNPMEDEMVIYKPTKSALARMYNISDSFAFLVVFDNEKAIGQIREHFCSHSKRCVFTASRYDTNRVPRHSIQFGTEYEAKQYFGKAA